MTVSILALTAVLSGAPSSPSAEALASAIDAAIVRFAPDSLWPGFDPSRVPLAVFDGSRTYLFRHPRPPAEFEPLAGRADARVAVGQHALVRGNTAVELAGTPTATLLLEVPERRSARELAAVAAHEAFHVFQSERHPSWGGNEVDLFTYPVDDPALLQLSRLEAEALRRALAARGKKSACWAAAALDVRRRRFEALGEKGAAYERGTELKEGLARVVERRALGQSSAADVLPKEDFPAGEVRSRSYAVGHALGVLLDRFAPGWERRLASADARALEDLLAQALPPSAGSCRFSPAERDDARARAERSVELARMTREAVRRDFLERGGWRIIVVAGPEPLFPERFDPLNVETVAPGEVFHTRWLKLRNSSGSVEVLDARALTESAGRHPLFDGVRKLTVTGLSAEPKVSEASGVISVRVAGITGEFRGARIERGDRTVTLTLSGN